MDNVSFSVLSEAFLYNQISTLIELAKTWLTLATGTVICIVAFVPYFELQHYAESTFSSHDIAYLLVIIFVGAE